MDSRGDLLDDGDNLAFFQADAEKMLLPQPRQPVTELPLKDDQNGDDGNRKNFVRSQLSVSRPKSCDNKKAPIR